MYYLCSKWQQEQWNSMGNPEREIDPPQNWNFVYDQCRLSNQPEKSRLFYIVLGQMTHYLGEGKKLNSYLFASQKQIRDSSII